MRLDPSLADAHYNLGNALAKERRYGEAVLHYREAVRLDPRNSKAHNNWGVALRALGREEEARSHFAEHARMTAGPSAPLPSGPAADLPQRSPIGRADPASRTSPRNSAR